MICVHARSHAEAAEGRRSLRLFLRLLYSASSVPLRALREIVVMAAAGTLLLVTAAAQPGPAPITFTDVTAAAGIHFKHENGAFGKKYLPHTMGSPSAFVDFHGHGRQDILLLHSSS